MLAKKIKKSDSIFMKKNKAVIFTGGLGPEFDRVSSVLKDAIMIIAADSGWDLAVSMGVEPEYYIGDMDSLNENADLRNLSAENIMKHPVDKDYTDTELAIKFLEDKNLRDIVLIGGGGGRIDHLMALLAVFNRETKPSQWFTAYEQVVFVDSDCRIDCKTGQTVSIFSCGKTEALVSTNGLKWELEKFKLSPDTFSISNVSQNEWIDLKIHSGKVLLILNY